MLRRFFILFVLTALSDLSAAQTYHWRRALPASCRSVAFNPRSGGRIIYAGPGRETAGIFRSDDGGETWTLYNTDTLFFPMNNLHQVFCVPGDTSVLLAVSPNYLYRSTNGGASWYIVSDTIGGVDGEDIAWHAADSTLYYGQNFGYALWKSKDLGATWFQTGFVNGDSLALCSLDVSSDVPPTIIQGATDSGFLARTTNDGMNWDVTMRSDTTGQTEVPKVVFSKYAVSTTGRNDVAIAIRWLSWYRSLVASPDGGLTWRILPSPSIYPWALDIDQRASMISVPGDADYPLPHHFFIGLFGATSDTVTNGMVQETTDGGVTWHSTNFPVGSQTDTANPIVSLVWVLKYDTTTARIAAATDSGVYIADTVAADVEPILRDSLSIVFGNQNIAIESPASIRSIQVFDLIGRIVARFEPDEDDYSFSTANFRSEVYAMRIDAENQPPTIKLFEVP